MTRDEAIEYILGLQNSVNGEHLVFQREYEEANAEVREALAALGVFAGEVEPVAAKGHFQ